MKKLIIFFTYSFILISCEKNIIPAIPDNPLWLNQEIIDMEKGPSFGGIKINLYLWNSEYYYHILNPISSCFLCTLYNYQGELQIWDEEFPTNFFKDGVFVATIWKHHNSVGKLKPDNRTNPLRNFSINPLID